MGPAMWQWHYRIGSQLRRLVRENSANVVMTFGLTMPVVLGSVGAAIDYSTAAATRTRMQAVADAAAINGGREFQRARATAASGTGAVQGYVPSQLKDGPGTAAPAHQALRRHVVVR